MPMVSNKKTFVGPAHPGIFLGSLLEERQVSQSELSRSSGLSFQRINGMIRGRRPITPDSALRIGRALGIDAADLVEAQAAFDVALLEKEIASELKKIKPVQNGA